MPRGGGRGGCVDVTPLAANRLGDALLFLRLGERGDWSSSWDASRMARVDTFVFDMPATKASNGHPQMLSDGHNDTLMLPPPPPLLRMPNNTLENTAVECSFKLSGEIKTEMGVIIMKPSGIFLQPGARAIEAF
jgi:hypothetical protein